MKGDFEATAFLAIVFKFDSAIYSFRFFNIFFLTILTIQIRESREIGSKIETETWLKAGSANGFFLLFLNKINNNKNFRILNIVGSRWRNEKSFQSD